MLAKAPPPPVFRQTDATRINALMNDPSVLPWVRLPGQDSLDLAGFIANPANVALATEDGRGGILFHQHEPGIYEAHTAFLPEARGRFALAATRSMIDFMFLMTDCMELLTKVPKNNRPAEALTRAVGGVLDFEREAAWPTDHGPVAVRYYRIDYPQWVRSCDLLPALGHEFHTKLEAENARLGIPDDLHPDDPAHDRHVGAAVGMIRCGQVGKGVILYNRWARLAGYEPIEVVSVDPLILDIRTHLLRIHGSNFEVISSCPQVQ